MKRVITIETELQTEKYILQEEYRNMGIYKRVTPSGFGVHQDWLIGEDGNALLICQPYNNKCYEEILDMIDNYKETGEFGVKGFDRKIMIVHPSGNIKL